MSTLGWIHTIFGVIALLSGTSVFYTPKGKRWHRTLGHVYLTTMLSLNISALFIYRLFGTFGPFHWLALYSLVTIIAGMVPVFLRKPRGNWLEWHSIFMIISYIGLVAAFMSEITSRLPLPEEYFGLVVGVTSGLTILIGAILIHFKLPTALKLTSAKRQSRSV